MKQSGNRNLTESVLTHGEMGNTQTRSQNSTKSLRLQPAVHDY